MQTYGLIGEKLTHSFSKVIHKKLGNPGYSLISLKRSELNEFFTKKEFRGINVTIPYKKDVIPYCDMLDERAKAIGSVNTIINRKGKLCGYNTDYDGFLYTLQKNHISVTGKTVLVLGNGGVSQTVQAVLRKENAQKILVASRTQSFDTISYAEAKTRKNVDIIVNATPVGMYPNVEDSPVGLKNFKNLSAVVDLIYNPLKTELLLEAEKLHVSYANGLLMLVAQAKAAAELFFSKIIGDTTADEIYNKLYEEKSNLVLIGMPMSGKTAVGKLAAKMLGREFIDTDAEIVKKAGMSISEIFKECGEEGFRKIERDVVRDVSLRNGIVISTGGGTPIIKENIQNLRRNGIIAFLDRPLEKLRVGKNRPLAKNIDEIHALYRKRYPIYLAVSDFIISNKNDIRVTADNLTFKYQNIVHSLPGSKKE